jgi:copper(I)-binding protein
MKSLGVGLYVRALPPTMTKFPISRFQLALTVASVFVLAQSAAAHSYRIGDLEIVHPAIVVPQPNSDCTCAHVTIINHGHETEYFLGAVIAIAQNARLLHVADHDHDISAPVAVAIAPGATLDLHRHEWCLFLSNIHTGLAADMGMYPASLMFRHAGSIDVEFMVDAAHP